MTKKITLIRCDKCGSTNVVDELVEDVEVKTLSMDDYIKNNKSQHIFSGDLNYRGGVSHMEKRKLVCRTCGYARLFDIVVYT